MLLPDTIHLGTFAFDPLAGDPAASLVVGGGFSTAVAPEGDDYVVQFAAPIRQAWLDRLRADGLELVQYVPHRAYLVHGSAAAIARARRFARVRAVLRYQSAHRLPAELLWAVGGAPVRNVRPFGRDGRATYDLALAKRAAAAPLENAVAAAGGRLLARLDLPSSYFDLLRVELPPEALGWLAARPGVIRIDPYVPPTAEDERAAQIVAGNYTGATTIADPGYDPASQFGVDGTGVTVAIVDDGIGIPGDGGLYVTSANAVDGPLRGAAAGADGHGHLNATIVAGTTPFGALDDLGYNYGRGIAPGAHLVNIPFLRTSPAYSGTEADTANDAVTTPGPNGSPATISNNSWGNGTNGNSYDSYAALFDALARDASSAGSIDPLLFVFSAGNSGQSGLTRPKTAKNLIAVAASENLRPTLVTLSGSTGAADNLEQVPDFSSRGTAADGRIKPDLTAPGAAVTGGRSGPNSLFGNIDSVHRHSTGTSHAAPQVAGAAALFTQSWKSSHGGDVPSPALVKAALLNGAVEMTGAGATAPIPNGSEGWGRVHLGNSLGTGVARQLFDQNALLDDPGDLDSETFAVGADDRPVRVTLVWSDPPAVGDPALVNDLDLELIAGGTIYRGNNFVAGISVAGGSAQSIDNVENVFLPAGALAAGTPFAVRVRAAALNGDGALGEGDDTDQRYALVVSNAVPATAAVLLASGSATTDESCAPANSLPDPGEAGSYTLCFENTGNAPTIDLVASLVASSTVEPTGGSSSYGALAPGASDCRAFGFVVAPALACGDPIELDFDLTDDGAPLADATATLATGALVADPPVTRSNATAVAIQDEGAASPYPSELAIADNGSIADLDLLLTDLSHTNPADIDLLLVSPAGVAATLLSDIGGTGNITNRNITLDDEASGPLPEALSSGSYKPTDLEPGDVFPAPAPAANAPAAMSSFDGASAAGTWKLFVADDGAGDTGSIGGGWSLRITLAHPVCATTCTLLFADGFERGDPTRWSGTVE